MSACRNAVGDYQAGVLDDDGLRGALLEAAVEVESAGDHLDRVVQAAASLPLFTGDALDQLRHALDRLTEEILDRRET